MGIENYRKIIESILTERAREEGEDKAVETQLAFDRERARYLMFHVGWRGERRIYGCVVHIELKDDKIWIQNDGIEIGIANELIAAGIPKSDIVLGFRSLYMRQFIDLAAGQGIALHCPYGKLRDRVGFSERRTNRAIAHQKWQLSPKEIADEYGLTQTEIDEILAFYKAHRSQIDAAIRAEETIEELYV